MNASTCRNTGPNRILPSSDEARSRALSAEPHFC